MSIKFRISSKARRSLNSIAMTSKLIRKAWRKIFKLEMVTTGSRITTIVHQTQIVQILHPIHLSSRKKTSSMLTISRKRQLLAQTLTTSLQISKKMMMISSTWFQLTPSLLIAQNQPTSFLPPSTKMMVYATITSPNLKKLTKRFKNTSSVNKIAKL